MTNISIRRAWKIVQALVWLVGVTMVALLVFVPDVGIHAFWNVLIPVAPALLVIAPGLWRNICPLSSTALFARRVHVGGERRRLSARANNAMLLGGVGSLLVLIPLRHVVLDLNGPATALMLIAATVIAVVISLRVEWKSGWCSGLCPIHPVEKLYGSKPLISPSNAHCLSCERCVDVCADSTPAMDPLVADHRGTTRALAGILMLGFFPGYIWGWFQIPDFAGSAGWAHLFQAYAWPTLHGAASLVLYLVLRGWFGANGMGRTRLTTLNRLAAAFSVSIYYWFRLPALFGFGPIPGDGMLVDLTQSLPAEWIVVSRALSTLFFFWWMLRTPRQKRAWSQRPDFAHRPPVGPLLPRTITHSTTQEPQESTR